ncbi:NUDIX hydrolase [Patescibacteria group bacterium]
MGTNNNKLTPIRLVGGVVVCDNGKFLLVQEKQKDVYGKWNVPAGEVEKGDNPEETAIREAKEETGYDVELQYLIKVCYKMGNRAAKFIYKAKIIGGAVAIRKNEILDVQWFTLDEMRAMKDQLRRPWVLTVAEIAADACKCK